MGGEDHLANGRPGYGRVPLGHLASNGLGSGSARSVQRWIRQGSATSEKDRGGQRHRTRLPILQSTLPMDSSKAATVDAVLPTLRSAPLTSSSIFCRC